MSAVPTQTTFKHIKCRSPFYVSFTTLEVAATMELRCWIGDRIGNYPANAQYTLVKRAVEGQVVFEISELIRDYIEQTSVLTSGNVWVQTDIDDGTTNTVVDYMATDGYMLYSEAVQTDSNVNDDGMVCLPGAAGYKRVMIPESGNSIIPWVPQAENALDWYYTKYDQNGSSLGTTTATYNDMANSRIQYVTVTPNVSKVDFTWQTGPSTSTTESVFTDVLRCSKYDEVQIIYVNKCGGKSYFPFILKHEEAIDIQSKRFHSSTMNYSTLSSTQGLHVANQYITDVTQEFTLNSDWIDEYYVNQFEEMMLSENIWMKKDGVVTAVTMSTKNMARKSHVNDRLINYTVKVRLATNYINDLR